MLVAFPFTDLSSAKVRPAAVVSRPLGDDVILAFITSRVDGLVPQAELVLRREDTEFSVTGLRTDSTIRMNKLVTLHRSLVRRRLGRLSKPSQERVATALRYVFEI